ncbi:MAG: hypothetical protein IJZ44_05930 [Lachnospiraceae bacterium]|nr:hypothetical protein [Lachnospiraceae bacterium]
MKEDKTINDGKVLYISGYGEDSNETVVYALNMPVSVTVYIDNNGSGIVEFKEKTEKDNWKHVCQTGFIPNATPPVRMIDFEKDYSLEDNIGKTVAGWISIYMRDGVFCTDSKKETFVSYLDLRDIAARVEKNLEDVYNKYRETYQ